MKNFKHIFLFSFFLLMFLKIHAQTSFYDLNTVQSIEISFTQANWDYQMDTAKDGAEGYIVAEWAIINGQQFDSVGVKYKGYSSYDSARVKNPLHISLDKFRSQSYQGFTDVKLSNGYSDPSMIREALSYKILSNYMDCPRANFAQVYINGNYIGLYTNDESIGSKFLSDHFYSSQNTLVKCNPVSPSPFARASLKYITADSSAYMTRYDLQSDMGWNELVSLCDTITNHPSSLSLVMDVDRLIWMLAFNNVLVNLDSYTGAFVQNYYEYKDNTGHFNSIVWDLNMSFGGFPWSGTQSGGMGTLDTTGMQQMNPLLHSAETDWPLINIVMNDTTYLRMYKAHLRTIANEMFANNQYDTIAMQLQSTINNAVQSDSNKFFTNAQFLSGMNVDASFGGHIIPGIKNLMTARVAYLQTAITSAPPTVASVLASDTFPQFNDAVTITANVSDPSSFYLGVYLGYRFDKTEKFTRVLMHDDGAHNDGAAGDNVYGASFTMSSAQAQYYIYAENSGEGIFSPQRAEHEFYNLNADIATAQPGQVIINEFLVVNQTDTVDANNQHEDWIELYNTTSTPLNLFGLYLSDNYADPTKYSFPLNSVIQPNSYFMLWADEDGTAPDNLHCNFKLAATGEMLMLSNAASVVLDSTSFGTQATDVSVGRCPNGTGPFGSLINSSFNTRNICTDGIDEFSFDKNIIISPNPCNSQFTIHNLQFLKNDFEIANPIGEIISKGNFSGDKKINTSQWADGIYFLRFGTVSKKIVVLH